MTTLSRNGPRSNGNDAGLYTPQFSRTGNLLSDAVECHTRTPIFLGGSYPSEEDKVSALIGQKRKFEFVSFWIQEQIFHLRNHLKRKFR